MSKAPWMPAEFVRLNSALLANTNSAQQLRYDIRSGKNGSSYVYGLGKAAAKLKLAQSFDRIVFNDYVQDTREGYTAQIKMMFSFVAFEAYCRLRHQENSNSKMSWSDLAAEIAPQYRAEAQNVRSAISAKSLHELEGFMHRARLKQRIRDFADGNDLEVFALGYALRNGLAHGLYGSRREFKRVSILMRELLLCGISDHCMSEIQRV